MNRYLLFIVILLLVGCASVQDVDASKAEPNCALQCMNSYNTCEDGGFRYVMPIRAHRECVQGLQRCINQCPAKSAQ